ncbi:MAG: preprotein translocase subunit SecE [Eubacteriales bacterium]
MAAKKFMRTALVIILTLALAISVSPLCVFADEGDATVSAVTDSAEPVDTADTAEPADAAPVDGESADTDTETVPDTSDTEAVSGETGAEDSAADTSDDTSEDTAAVSDEKKSGISTGTIVSIVIVAVIVVAAAVYCIKNREKVAKFFRECKSELKKIVWTPWKQVKKNTVVVIIIVIICAVIIGLLDLLFSKGIIALGDLF